jgi:hypothetical protein
MPPRPGAPGKGAPQAVRGTVGGLTELARSPAQEAPGFSFHTDIVRAALVVLKNMSPFPLVGRSVSPHTGVWTLPTRGAVRPAW